MGQLREKVRDRMGLERSRALSFPSSDTFIPWGGGGSTTEPACQGASPLLRQPATEEACHSPCPSFHPWFSPAQPTKVQRIWGRDAPLTLKSSLQGHLRLPNGGHYSCHSGRWYGTFLLNVSDLHSFVTPGLGMATTLGLLSCPLLSPGVPLYPTYTPFS